jgi:predicted secreted protein
MEPVTLTEDDGGAKVRVAPGQRVLLRLRENPTTGYRWSVPDDVPADVEVIANTLERAGHDERGVPAAGAGGVRVVTLIAPDREAQLELRLKRPGKNGKVDRTLVVVLIPSPD